MCSNRPRSNLKTIMEGMAPFSLNISPRGAMGGLFMPRIMHNLETKINRQGHFAMPQAYKNDNSLHPKVHEIGHERASHGSPRADIQ